MAMGEQVTSRVDPEGVESRAIHRLLDFAQKDVLEIGCGDGRLTRSYMSDASSVLAIDTNKDKLEIAGRKTNTGDHEQLHFQQSDVSELESDDSSFDIIIFSRSIC